MTTYRDGLLAAAQVCKERADFFKGASEMHPLHERERDTSTELADAILALAEQEDQRGAAHSSRVGSTPGDATRLDSSLGVAGAVQSAPHQNAGTTAQRPVAESQAPAPSEPGDRGVAPTLDAARPALSGPETVSVPRERIEALLEYWNGNRNDSAMFDALDHIEGELSAMLAAERKEEGNG